MRASIAFVAGDGVRVLEDHAGDPGAVVFVDPPYTIGDKRAGSRMYDHHEVDNERLFAIARQFAGPLLMTLPDDPAVDVAAFAAGLGTHKVQMRTTHHSRRFETLASNRDLTPTVA
jgi:DNA adenine methylase